MSPTKKLLVINPNSSRAMTAGFDQLLVDLAQIGPSDIDITTYTAPAGPSSINNEDDALESAHVVIADLESTHQLAHFDAFLVACYSVHPLVPMIRSRVTPRAQVTGIFEASITTALTLLPRRLAGSSADDFDKFGIVSTGKYWEKALSEGVLEFVGVSDMKSFQRFKGVETTGLTAEELHTVSPELVRQKMTEATQRLVKDRDVKVICLGCAGMAGMDIVVEEALIAALGKDEAQHVYVVDGVKVGIAMLTGLVRAFSEQKKHMWK